MEIIIVICLLIVIVLLAKDKIIIKKVVKNKQQQPATNRELPEIMGKPKPIERHSVPTAATQRQKEKQEDIPDNFETETHETGFAREIPPEELDDVFGSEPVSDFENEDEEWEEQGLPNSDNGFATGVTYEELTTVGALLQQDVLEAASQQKAVDIVQRMQGTELFSLLENSIAGASRKIAELLDRSLPAGADFSSSDERKSSVEGFDIGEFV
ncbi:conjugal transfer protein TraD [Elizabethkingia anophelis]|nr:conjugal transfer protein TraD [Terrimonas sp.]MDV3734912.1 conjugal transfer protein TraD [Elizabethkingia anophelis]MDV3964586.1 conjugal transfer protein TraD [Elizabethkingia anophelis]OJY93909.1 MAG: conjugal transfer protein TraD [Sphingobacteriales bacterium 40-81]